MNKREEAKSLMRHYMRVLAKGAGVRWDGDNVAEIDTLVDLIVDAAIEEVTEQLKETAK